MNLRVVFAATILFASSIVGCKPYSGSASQAPSPPAKVDKVAVEDDLAKITLTPEAESRLRVATVAAERRNDPRTRTWGGEVVVPPGQAVTVASPLAGTLQNPAGAKVPAPGNSVKLGQAIFSLVPLLSPERAILTPAEQVQLAEARTALARAQIEAQGDVDKAGVQLDAAKVGLERAQKLLRDNAGSEKALDEAKAQVEFAQRTLQAAEARRNLLAKTTLETEAGTLTSLQLVAPEAGLLQNVHARPGQTVTAGAALFEVVRQHPLWVRVPVYAGDLPSIQTERLAEVRNLSDSPGSQTHFAKPIEAPPSANPLAATVDLYYELDNQDGSIRPGQRFAVTLQLRDEEESLVVPWAAVIHDIYGGTWVYENARPQVYVRRRVQVRRVTDGLAILASGPAPGAKVVTDGAAELFGTEFGFAK